MTTRPRDTTADAWRRVEDGLRRMTPGERVRRALDLSALAQGFALAQILPSTRTRALRSSASG